MERNEKSLVGALVPKEYADELYDKLHHDLPKSKMSYLIRTLLGLWFDGQIIVNKTSINTYKADRRKTNRFGNQIIEGAKREGFEAAGQNIPLLSNPHKEGSAARIAWDEGWKAYFNKV